MQNKILFTDDAKYVADEAGAFWLDEIALAQRFEASVAPQPFQLWKLDVANNAASLTCEDGNGNAAYSKLISFTDCTMDGTVWKLLRPVPRFKS
jgi:hypothetical protein